LGQGSLGAPNTGQEALQVGSTGGLVLPLDLDHPRSITHRHGVQLDLAVGGLVGSHLLECGQSKDARLPKEFAGDLLSGERGHEFPHLTLAGQSEFAGNALIALADLGHQLIQHPLTGNSRQSQALMMDSAASFGRFAISSIR
jgi:hypothetical protein